MWSALTSDLQEFVSTVKNDTTTVLQKIDAGMEKEEGSDTFDEDDDNKKEDEKPKANNHEELREILSLMMEHPGTYTDPLEDEDEEEGTTEVEEFKAAYSSEGKTEEIAALLEEHPILKEQFEKLCPTQVSYVDFWMRYFYRCDPDRLARQLEEETTRERLAREEAVRNGINSVANFFGGAVKAVSQTLAESPDNNNKKSTGGQNFFGSVGRPPFVMNTAVDDSFDNEDQKPQEEDEEEELGWDDDEEDDFDNDNAEGNDGVKSDAGSEQIEFTDQRAENLEEQLRQALAERDLMKETVEMQAKEVAMLKSQYIASSKDNKDGSANTGPLEALKLQLFEKEAELAAIKASHNDVDTHHHEDESVDKVAMYVEKLRQLSESQLTEIGAQVFGGGSTEKDEPTSDSTSTVRIKTLEDKIEESSKEMVVKNTQLAELEGRLRSSEHKLSESEKKLQAEGSKTSQNASLNKELTSKVETLEETLVALESEKESLQQTLDNAEAGAASKVRGLHEEIEALRGREKSLQSTVATSQQDHKDALARIEILERELSAAKENSKASLELQPPPAMPSSPSSESTGEKVDTTSSAPSLLSTPAVPKTTAAVEDDDWGDDW